jgi:hypothetical protein
MTVLEEGTSLASCSLEGGREEKVSEEDYHIPDGRKKMNEVANSILPIDWTIHSDTGRTQLT